MSRFGRAGHDPNPVPTQLHRVGLEALVGRHASLVLGQASDQRILEFFKPTSQSCRAETINNVIDDLDEPPFEAPMTGPSSLSGSVHKVKLVTQLCAIETVTHKNIIARIPNWL